MCWSLPKAVCFIRRLYSSPSFNQRPPAKDVYNGLEAGVYRGLARYAWLRMVRNQESPGTQVQHTLEAQTKGTEFRHFLASDYGTVRVVTKFARTFAPLTRILATCLIYQHSESDFVKLARASFNVTAQPTPWKKSTFESMSYETHAICRA